MVWKHSGVTLSPLVQKGAVWTGSQRNTVHIKHSFLKYTHFTETDGETSQDKLTRLAIKKQKGKTAFKGYGTHIKVKGDPVTFIFGGLGNPSTTSCNPHDYV